MALRTPLCDILGIEHPIMLAGMGGISYAEVCAAVSAAGGFGCLGAAAMSPDQLRDEMRRVKDLTDKPFGVDLLAAVPDSLTRSVDIMINEGATAFVSGLGTPTSILKALKEAGVVVIQLCGTVKHAVKGEEAGVDVLIGQGTEGGGHTGLVATMPLIAQIVETVHLPVVAAGGITDGRGLAAALALGAQGVWMGTRFLATQEAHAHADYKQRLVESNETDTLITRSYSGKPMRVVKNEWTAEWETPSAEIKGFPEQAYVSGGAGVMGPLVGDVSSYNRSRDATAAGQSVGAVFDIPKAGAVVHEVLREAEATIARLAEIGQGRYAPSQRQGSHPRPGTT